jgi:hypothetical protein
MGVKYDLSTLKEKRLRYFKIVMIQKRWTRRKALHGLYSLSMKSRKLRWVRYIMNEETKKYAEFCQEWKNAT